MPRRRALRLAALGLAAATLGPALHTPPAAAGPPSSWRLPVDGEVLRPFAPGLGPYHAGGHLGLDLAAPPGTPVVAAGPGVVSFAGPVAGILFVVVLHAGELRTTYGGLASRAVSLGQRVDAGERVGTTGLPWSGHPEGGLHFGLRRGDEYLDPRLLFAPPDLTQVVALAPPDGPLPPTGDERRALLEELSRRGEIPGWMAAADEGVLGGLRGLVRRGSGWVGDRIGDARAAVSAAGRGMSALSRGVGRGGAVLGQTLVLLSRLALGNTSRAVTAGVAAVRETAAGVRDWWRLRRRCSPPSRGSRPLRPRGHHLVRVGGVGSSPGFGLPAAELGYGPADVTDFSYDPRGRPGYQPSDTWVGPRRGAELLAAQLAALAVRHPGITVDLIGHSQGGVVIEVFLKDHWAREPSRYPRLGRVVTIAAPHRGVPLAGAAARYGALPLVGRLLDGVAAAVGAPPVSSATVQELRPGSPLLRRMAATPLPPGVRVTAIGAGGDLLVPATRTRLRGAEHVVVHPEGLADHSEVVADPATLRAARLALSGAPPPCRSLLQSVWDRLEPAAVDELSQVLDPASRLLPADAATPRRRRGSRARRGYRWSGRRGAPLHCPPARTTGPIPHARVPSVAATGGERGRRQNRGRRAHGGRHDEAAPGGGRPLRAPDPAVEPEDAPVHLR